MIRGDFMSDSVEISIKNKIELLKSELNELLSSNHLLNSDELLKLSQKLDKLINEYYSKK